MKNLMLRIAVVLVGIFFIAAVCGLSPSTTWTLAALALGAALAAPREIIQTNPDAYPKVGVDTNVIVYEGAIIWKTATGGHAAPAVAEATGKTVLGLADFSGDDPNGVPTGQAASGATDDYRALRKLVMTGITAGTKYIKVRRGCFELENKAGDLVTEQHVGVPVHVDNDQTVRATAAATSPAGVLLRFHPRSGKPMVILGEGRGIY